MHACTHHDVGAQHIEDPEHRGCALSSKPPRIGARHVEDPEHRGCALAGNPLRIGARHASPLRVTCREKESHMNILRIFLIAPIVFLLILTIGCSRQETVTLDEALAFYNENKLEQALPLLVRITSRDKDNPEAYAWLAETCRRLGKKEQALDMARLALRLDPRSSFAHTVIAEVSNPVMGDWTQANSDTTWFHVMRAIECDSTDGNPWLLVWGEAIRRGEPSLMRKSLRKLVGTGFLTKAALSYGRWMLRALPDNAILITNGDMDTYPPCAVQEVEGLRKDVVIVNRGALNITWYARFIRDEAGVPLPVDDSQLDRLEAHKDDQGNLVTPSGQILRGWMQHKAKGLFTRPIAFAVTVDENSWFGIRGQVRFSGAFLQWFSAAGASAPDTASMRASLEGLSPDDFTGPWVSDQDRSPIRRTQTKNLVRNVTEVAIGYGELLMKAKQYSEARHWAGWADELDRKAELGPVFTERIARLKEDIDMKTP